MTVATTKREERVAAVVQVLTDAGWVPGGSTEMLSVRIASVAAPVYGGIGGELKTFGGRPRYHLPGTERRCTVGPRTVCFYRIAVEVRGRGGSVSRQPADFRNYRADDLEGIRSAARANGGGE